jgi:predicted RNA-binding protein with PIN domain
VVQLVATALPEVIALPSPLKRVAGFAPARRARLGGGAISSALSDDDFRSRAGTQVAARLPEEPDEVDLAAVAWLQRTDGWQDTVADAVRRLSEREVERTHSAEDVERLRAQVLALQGELRQQRAAARAALDEAKAENSVLRRRLGEARSATRSAAAERDAAQAALDDAARQEAAAVAAAQSEVRRLQARLDEVAADLSMSRRDARSGRDAATIRARYLLDTVLEAAAGLRRELALPAAEGAPGDATEETLASAEEPRQASGPLGSIALEQVLALPRARLVVDGYNVTKRAWDSATLEAQRSKLVAALGPLVARTGAETTVVFDAAASTTRTAMPAPRGVKVVFSPAGVIADDVIRALVEAEPQGRVVVVVSDDQELVRDVRRTGARAATAEALLKLVGR